ncbi:hypothetical protein [Bacillus cereus]|uniref:P/Homo B domain-containing protein n=1 Tax=Bacillus cereus TaxID=1396 RepID=A0A2B9DYZ9_BACCE|nr:hypothetical protein [Bacillus cereus]PGM97968.1 hypothetical protein CN958_01580 [Bacillus cereus]
MIKIIVKCIILINNQYYLRTIIKANGNPIIINLPITAGIAALLKHLGIPDCCTASTQTFSNPTSIVTPDSGIADPYPSQIIVNGMSGVIEKVTVTLRNINSTFSNDLDILLVGPQGQTLILMSDAGGEGTITNVTLTLDDIATNGLPFGALLTSGTFKPSNYSTSDGADNWPNPSPIPPYGDPALGQGLSVFNNTNPNGVWNLYVVDDQTGDISSITGGWELTITTSCPE